MCFVTTSEQRVNFALHSINRLVLYSLDSVYCAVRTESLQETDVLGLERVN